MKGTPKNECIIGSMPNAAYKECNEKVKIAPEKSLSVSSKGNIEIVFEPSRKAYVPVAPEVYDSRGKIWLSEVLHQVKSKNLCNTNGNI